MIYGLQHLNGTHPTLWGAIGYLGLKSKYDWKIISGPRDSDKQDALYAIGRAAGDTRATVTDARGGQSAHNFGLALDVAPTFDKGASIAGSAAAITAAHDECDSILVRFPGIKAAITTSSGADRPHIEVKDWQQHKDWKTTVAVVTVLSAVVGIAVLTAR